nr:hypothetical protein [Microbacterium bovistercoris]
MRGTLILRPRPGAVFTVRGAAAAGVSRGRLDRHPEVRAPLPGVRIRVRPARKDEPPWETRRRTVLQLATAYQKVMPASAFLSHTTAAEVFEGRLPLPAPGSVYDLAQPGTSLAGLIEASALVPRRSPRAGIVTGHQMSPGLCHVVEHDGYRVSDPASTWAMLADRLTVEELVVLGDSFVRRARVPGTPLDEAPPASATLDDLAAAMNAGRRVGVDRLRRALPLIRTGSSSDLETLQRLGMRDDGLPEPTLDVDVYDESGTFLGCSEIVYIRYKIAVEREGDQHRTSRAQWNRDIRKYQAYSEAGWMVVRVTGQDVRYDRAEAVRRVRAALLQRGWRPGEPA